MTCTFATFTVALLGFIYLKTKHDLTLRSDRAIAAEIENLVALRSGERLDAINDGLQYDPGRHRMVGLFGAHGDRIAGDMEREPADLRIDGTAQNAVADRIGGLGREQQAVRLIARTLPDGNVLLVGRDVDEIEEIARVVGGTLALGLFPAVFLCIAVGTALSARARKRIVEVNERVQRIVAGNLRERLPLGNSDDPLSQLATIVMACSTRWRLSSSPSQASVGTSRTTCVRLLPVRV
ncbi:MULTISPECIES: hypothetical protein [unclassified Bradyrhizobium]|uniref:hypothetical protein n=1 Tax=unclassified Bradyrhizobium TaxID=2631580 RepID=UPI0033932C3B